MVLAVLASAGMGTRGSAFTRLFPPTESSLAVWMGLLFAHLCVSVAYGGYPHAFGEFHYPYGHGFPPPAGGTPLNPI